MKSNHFKKVTVIKLLMFSMILTLISCSSDDADNGTGTTDNYYVKYVITGNGAYGRFSNWTATTPQGNYTNNGTQVRNWSQTYGPANKWFNCRVQIGDYISGTPNIEIHVSKNDEPFSLKKSVAGTNASYTIN
jgi:hypothetical protein